jgi:hypothetical protein
LPETQKAWGPKTPPARVRHSSSLRQSQGKPGLWMKRAQWVWPEMVKIQAQSPPLQKSAPAVPVPIPVTHWPWEHSLPAPQLAQSGR